LKNKYGSRATDGDKSLLEMTRNEANRLEELVKNMKNKTAPTSDDEKKTPDVDSEFHSDSDNEDDYVDDLPIPLKNNRGPRVSVSAETFAAGQKKEKYKHRIIVKSEQAKEAILEKIE
jgi:hypothetical protein